MTPQYDSEQELDRPTLTPSIHILILLYSTELRRREERLTGPPDSHLLHSPGHMSSLSLRPGSKANRGSPRHRECTLYRRITSRAGMSVTDSTSVCATRCGWMKDDPLPRHAEGCAPQELIPLAASSSKRVHRHSTPGCDCFELQILEWP
ncbi:hypothetical protein BU23DRAFT_122416 [Bimuria novae-zelandiae CBS 107.79]|uniref:Uncharacterized protein n=1 Tax=Bimuria novae-zelandiae CBS 107.79 TaxID=1447943 RepID=A0A6A5VA73_9PLEO|nr:hypothetical protein BU23DRAFT_122416 [Bimuria novae-zelandiae CBS 107.79]